MTRPVVLLALACMTTLPGSVAAGAPPAQAPVAAQDEEIPEVLRFTVTSITGDPVDLARYRGKVLLVVNTASQCGYTPQYAGLQALHEKYASRGLAVLGFPANDFGAQEPGSNAEIQAFCTRSFGVTFDMFAKVSVTGEKKAPLYRWLTSQATNPSHSGEVKWNFEKFLVGRDGKVVGRFGSAVKPDAPELLEVIEASLSGQ